MADILTDDDAAAGSTSGTTFTEDETLLTKEGLKKLKDELEHLKSVRRQEVANRLKEAISYGDLSENSEYEEAKNEQAFLEGRILELEDMIKKAKIISEKKSDARSGKIIDIGSSVTVVCTKLSDEPQKYTIVGSTEADPLDHKVSNESPIGRALLGKTKGDTVVVSAPAGDMKYEILNVA